MFLVPEKSAVAQIIESFDPARYFVKDKLQQFCQGELTWIVESFDPARYFVKDKLQRFGQGELVWSGEDCYLVTTSLLRPTQ